MIYRKLLYFGLRKFSFPFLKVFILLNGSYMCNVSIILQQTRTAPSKFRPIGSEAEASPEQSLLDQLQRRNAVRGAVRLHAVALAVLPPCNVRGDSAALKAFRS
jgi:hypothetical protein